MKVAYLDTSAIVKRYVEEPGSEVISGIYNKVLSGELKLAFSVWNIGEVLGVLDKYFKRGRQQFLRYRFFIGLCWSLVRKYLLDVSPVPLGTKGAHDPHVKRLVATMKYGVEAQPVLARPTMT